MIIDGIKMLSAAALFSTASTLPLQALSANYPSQGGYSQPQSYYGYRPVANYNYAWANQYYGYNPYQKAQLNQPQARYQRKAKPGYPQMAYHYPAKQRGYNYVKPQQQNRQVKQLNNSKNQHRQFKVQKKVNKQPASLVYAYNYYPSYRANWQANKQPVQVYARANPYKSQQRPQVKKQRSVNQWAQTKPQAAAQFYNWNYAKYNDQSYHWPTWQANYTSYVKPQKIRLKAQKPVQKQKPMMKQVSITEQGFMPSQLKVKRGDRVIWANIDGIPHQVNSQTGWQSKILTRGATYAHTFSKPGVYKYYSASKPKWSGQVLVQ